MSTATFYPQHFKKTRSYAKAYIAQISEAIAAGTVNPESSYDISADHILKAYFEQGVSRAELANNVQAFTVENQIALAYGEWLNAGSALYLFEPELADALQATKVGEITLSDVKFPFDHAYIHFGPRPGLTLQSGAMVTGAYVLWYPGRALRIMLTAPLPDNAQLVDRWAEVYDLRILARSFDVNLELAISQALDDDYADVRAAVEKIARDDSGRAQAGARAGDAFLDRHELNKDVFARSVELIVNALCYVTAFAEDIRTDWPAGAPERLTKMAEQGSPKEKARAQSKLYALGHLRVRHVGGDFAKALRQPTSGITPHWRSGHWRPQAYGPKHSLRKIIWIRPTRVLGGAVSDEPRIYHTEKPRAG
jgi:hypothetical protein